MNSIPIRQFILFSLIVLFIGCEQKEKVELIFSPIENKPSKVKSSDFAGAKECQSCHPDIYDQWSSSTHGNAGGLPTVERVKASFDGEPIEFRDVIVFPEINQGIYQFRIQDKQSNVDELVTVEAVVGGGFMYGGGTQTFFAKYPDGSYRFLPFDYSVSNQTWFVQLASNEEWVTINKNISLDQLYNWPPH